jgi:1-acyl-sn-glycerol-3-phosphate acyltransferase
MQSVLGLGRVLIATVALLLGALMILLIGWLPVRIGGCRPAAWVVVGLARLFVILFHIKVVCPEAARLQAHRGFIFPNHDSYLDILVLLSITPVRFLSMAAVRTYPVIGGMAAAIGTVFVDREDSASRKAARSSLAASLRQEPHPPIVVFPEGKIQPGDEVLPFRYGAFALACENQIAYLPCALRYRPLDLVTWNHGESLVTALWRLACAGQPLYAELMPLPAFAPATDADPTALANTARLAIERAIASNPLSSIPVLSAYGLEVENNREPTHHHYS